MSAEWCLFPKHFVPNLILWLLAYLPATCVYNYKPRWFPNKNIKPNIIGLMFGDWSPFCLKQETPLFFTRAKHTWVWIGVYTKPSLPWNSDIISGEFENINHELLSEVYCCSMIRAMFNLPVWHHLQFLKCSRWCLTLYWKGLSLHCLRHREHPL